MNINGLLCCQQCGAMFRPKSVTDLCSRCEKDEEDKLKEIQKEIDSGVSKNESD